MKNFPSDNTKLAEMEFYLVDDLECDLTIYHPYRSLLALCTKESAAQLEHIEPEAGELGAGIGTDDGPRYWGTGEGRLQLALSILLSNFHCGQATNWGRSYGRREHRLRRLRSRGTV